MKTITVRSAPAIEPKWSMASSADDVATLKRIDCVLDVLTPRGAPAAVDGALSDEQVEAKVQQMGEARTNRDYATSDAIRDELTAAGIEVQIARDAITWKRKLRLDG